MIENLICLGVGMLIGAVLMLVFVVISFEREMRPRKKSQTKDEWRMM